MQACHTVCHKQMCMFFVAAVAVWNCTHLSDFIPQILKAKLHHGHALQTHRSPLWGSLRAGAQPMFHSENLSAYAGTINKAVDELITNLSAVAKSGKEVNIFTQLGQMTMQVTGAAAFG